jgi:hypothetical protein
MLRPAERLIQDLGIDDPADIDLGGDRLASGAEGQVPEPWRDARPWSWATETTGSSR